MPKTPSQRLSKKQKKALDSLIYDLDELDNKPRRLFESLRNLAEEFIPAKDFESKQHKNEILDSIDEYEKYYYLFLNIPELTHDIMMAGRETKRELTSRNKVFHTENERERNYFESGVDEACNLLTKKIISELAELND